MKKNLLTIFAIAAAFVACNKTEAPVAQTGSLVQFSTAFNTYTVKSAVDNTLENGSSVGIYAASPIGATNIKYNKDVDATTLSADATGISWLIGQNGTQDFYAYYPYSNTATVSSIPVSINTDQSIIANLNASDFVWGSATGVTAGTSSRVGITLNHKLTKVIIRIDNNLAQDVTGVKITGLKNTATAVPSTGVIGEMSGSGDIVAYHNSANDGWDDSNNETVDTRNREYIAIVLPESTVTPSIVVTVADSYEYTYTLTSAYTFVGGNTATAAIAINPGDSEAGEEATFSFTMGEWANGAAMSLPGTTPTPTQPENKWSIIGTINGSNWNQDFYMSSSENNNAPNEVKITFTYAAGNAFKLRYNNAWGTQAGAPSTTALAANTDIILASSNNHDITLSGGAGTYTIYFDPVAEDGKAANHLWIVKEQ